MRVRLTHLDGKLPNLALMKLAHWHRAQGHEVVFSRAHARQLFDKDYDRVYGSTIFKFSGPARATFLKEFPEAVVGGTGSDSPRIVEEITGFPYEKYDYSIYPDYEFSVGFTQRGCRLSCAFCVVPAKEGRPRPTNTIHQIWRGAGHKKNIVLLDNDFFGQPRAEWQARIKELNDGGFKVSFNQGINVRLMDEEACRALGTVRYYDDQFKVRRLYTAWDNLRDEGIFFKGIRMLEAAGIRPQHVMVYMLIGYDPKETWEQRLYRFGKMVDIGLNVYPMVYENRDPELKWFQRWAVRRYYKFIPWAQFTKEGRRTAGRRKDPQAELI